jgi:hypothetical protein
MNKINLSKRDKLVLKNTFDDEMDVDVLPKDELFVVAKHLEDIGLIEIQMSCGELRTARLTNLGKKYKLENPRLRNAITDTNKWIVSTIITVILAMATIVIQLLRWTR